MNSRRFWTAVVLIGVLVGLTAARLTLGRRTIRASFDVSRRGNAAKGDVKRAPDGKLLYFDGHRWTETPPPPQDSPF